MEAEVALYWRTVCKHLQMEAQVSLFNNFTFNIEYFIGLFHLCFSFLSAGAFFFLG